MYQSALLVLILCAASSAAPLGTGEAVQHRKDFAQGIFIITQYYRSRTNVKFNNNRFSCINFYNFAGID